MDAQENNLCLLNMPVLLLEKILSNIHNPSNVSRTCKYLYEIVCGMETHWSAVCITASPVTSSLNIDADAVFNSIMSSRRTIKEMELRLTSYQSYQLNERQLERMTAIMKRFGANVTSLKLSGSDLPINFILEMLQPAPEMESLSVSWGNVKGSVPENSTVSLHLPSLKALEVDRFYGILAIVNLLPAGSLNSINYFGSIAPPTALNTILTKQYNVKSLAIDADSNWTLSGLRIDHLQLERLTFKKNEFDEEEDAEYELDKNNLFLEILKCQPNLKELRFVECYCLNGSVFQWICTNLKKLEVFDVTRLEVNSIEGNAFEMLGELKHLRHFRTSDGEFLFDKGFQSSQFETWAVCLPFSRFFEAFARLLYGICAKATGRVSQHLPLSFTPRFKGESIEKFEIEYRPEFRCGELLTKMVSSMAHNLPNVTHLNMTFENFSALCFVLRHCTQIIHLRIYIRDPVADQLTQQRFPNIQTLQLTNCEDTSGEMMSQSMTSIVRAMPNVNSMSLLIESGIKFDVNTMKEFVNESRSLEYFRVDEFVLHPELSTDDAVEIIQCFMDQLKGYHIIFSSSPSSVNLNFRRIKDILSKKLYVRDVCRKSFYLFKGGKKKFCDDDF